MSFIESSFRFSLSATTLAALANEARLYADTYFPKWDFDNDADLGRFILDTYFRAKIQDQRLFNGWVQEAFLASCRMRSSAVSHAVSRGYKPRSATPSIGKVTLVVEPSPVDVAVPRFSIQTSTRLLFPASPVFAENAQPLNIPAGTTTLLLDMVAGRSFFTTYVGSGKPDQWVLLVDQAILDNSFRVTDSAGNTWEEVEDFSFSGPDDLHFTTAPTKEGFYLLSFGDGSAGASLTSGVTATIHYRVGGGRASNVRPETMKTAEALPAGLVAVSCTNTDKFENGEDQESIDSIKKNAPAANRQRKTIARVEEAVAFAESLPGVVRAFGQLFANSILISIVPVGGGFSSQPLKDAVQTQLGERLIMGYSAQAVDPTYATATVDVSVTTRLGFVSSEITSLIRTAILNYLDPEAKEKKTPNARMTFRRQFGEPLRVNAIKAILDSFYKLGAIEQDFVINQPTADITVTADTLFSNVGSTVTVTSTNTTKIPYKV